MGSTSLNFLQSRLLVITYEVGHGLYPSVITSMAACARACRALILEWQLQQIDDNTRNEEHLRTWWAVHNLER